MPLPFYSIQLLRDSTQFITALPTELKLFYSEYEGVGMHFDDSFPVRIAKLNEVKQITAADVKEWSGSPPMGWQNFSAFTIGCDQYFCDILLVVSCPSCPPGSVLVMGTSIAGPGGVGDHQLENTFVLSYNFSAWIDLILEYGTDPFINGVTLYSDTVRSHLYQYYVKLNPHIDRRKFRLVE